MYTIIGHSDENSATHAGLGFVAAVKLAIRLHRRLGMWVSIFRPDGTEALFVDKFGEASTSPAKKIFGGAK